MSDQDSKSVDFNPLDILASAAATLKQVDKRSNSTMTQQRTQQRQSVTPATEGRSNTSKRSDSLSITDGTKSSNKNTKSKDNNGVKKIRVVTTLSSDLEKMLDEHNYGNSRKNLSGKSLTDVNLPGGSSGNSDTKDRKVVVTVVNKTGDHHVIRTINNIKQQSTEKSSTDKEHSCDNITATGYLPKAAELATDICEDRCSTGEHIDQGVTENCTESSVNSNADNCNTAGTIQSTGSTSTCRSCSESDNKYEHHTNKVIHTLSGQCDKYDANTTSAENENTAKNCSCTDVNEESDDTCSKCDNNRKKDDNHCQSTATEKQDEKCDNKIDSLNVHLQPNEKSHIHMVSVVSKPDTSLSRPQTVVINIGHNKDAVSTNLASPTAKGDNTDSGLCSKVEKQDTRESKSNIVRSLLTCEKEDVKCPEKLSVKHALKVDNVHETLNSENSTNSTCQEKSDLTLFSCSSETESNTAVNNSDGDKEMTDSVLPHSESETVILKNAEGDNECKQTCVNTLSVANKLQANPDLSNDNSSSLSSNVEVGDNGKPSNQLSGKEKDFINKSVEGETANGEVLSERANEEHLPSIDHCYAETIEPFQPQQQRYATRKSNRLHSTESLLSDLSQDSGFGDFGNSPGTPVNSKIEAQRQSVSSDLSVIDCKQPVKVIASSPLLLSSDDASSCSKISSLLEMGSSGISSLQDLNDVNKARDAIIALVQSSESLSTQNVMVTPVKSTGAPASNSISPKIGKYRIGTFASVSKSTFGLESPKKHQGIIDAQKLILTPKSSTPTSLLSKMNGTGKSVLPQVISSQVGTNSSINMPGVVGSSGKLSPSQTSEGSVNHVEHDHDYCLPAAAMSSSPHLMAKLLKDTVFLKQGHVKTAVVARDKRSDSTDSYKRPRKVSVSASDLSDSMDVPSPSSVVSDSPLSPLESASVPQPMSTRQKAKSEKAAEYVRSGNSASKLKITGKFQDDYIYFLNTKVRSRRRTNSQDIPSPVPADRIIVPAPKPGDIVVPHLTDADLEAIKHGQHASVKPPSSLNLLGSISSPTVVGKLQTQTSTASLIPPTSVESMSSPTTATASGTISDEENKIINTILSMESCDSTTSGGTTVPELPDSSVVTAPPLPSSDSFSLNFIPEQLNLTNEQMEILYSAMDEVQSLSPDLTPSGDKFPIPPVDDSTSEANKKDKVLLEENSPDKETKSQERSGKETSVPSTKPAEDTTPPLAESAAVTTETIVSEDEKCLSETKELVPLSGTSVTNTEASSVDVAPTTNSPTVKSLLHSGSVKTLIQDADSISQNKMVNIETTPTSVRSLLQADRNTVKSLLTNSTNSVVNTMPEIPFTSLDKSSLDLFGNDLKLFPEASVTESRQQIGTTSVAMTTPPSTSTDHSAPWIVTVSMFWNDLPAIMINNLPFVRLVDIHKQILPAKDTGILKKRCQLLGINVANCTEMQRYFLVQYGKAFNSKSTLIVGKDDAKVLIGYYVNPVPKLPRGEDLRTNERTEEPRPVHTVASKGSRSSTGSKSKSQAADQWLSSVSTAQESPAPVSTPTGDKIESPTISTTPASPAVVPVVKSEALTLGTTVSPVPPQETIQTPQKNQRISQRTRHKKINFLEMLKGDANNNTTNSAGSPDSVKTEVSDEKEVVPSLKMDDNENVNDVTKIQKKAPVKRKASPVLKKDGAPKSEKVKAKKVSDEIDSTKFVNSCDSGPTEDPCTGESEAENKVHQDKYPLFVGKRGSKQNDREQMMKKLKTVKAKKPGSLKVKWTIFNKSNSKKTGLFTNSSSNNKNSGKSESCRSEILAVIHKDMVSRNGDKRRMQAGNVFLDQYKGKDAACVRCCTCKKLFTVDMFLTHLHEIGGNGKLLVVSQPQTIALRDMYPTEIQKRMWQSFQKRRRALANVKSEDVKTVDTSQQDVLVENHVQKVGNLNGTERLVKSNPVVKTRNSVPPITPSGSVSNRNVRISARKRKQKQLYPIENYSFARKVHQQQSRTITSNIQIESDGDEPMSPLAHNDSDSCNGSPSKVQKLMSLSSEDELSLGDSVSASVASKVTPESVLTLTTNGPEVISFTALQQDEGLDI